MTKSVIFDLDGTLLDRDTSIEQFVSVQYDRLTEVEQFRKPQVEIFQRAMNRLGVSASESVFIGDHPEADICGAKAAMMKTIWKRSLSWTEAKEADEIVDALSEISGILAQFNSL